MRSASGFVLAIESLRQTDLIHDTNPSDQQLRCSVTTTVLDLLIQRDRLLIRIDRFVVLAEPLMNVAHPT